MKQGVVVVTYKVDQSALNSGLDDAKKKIEKAAKDNDNATKKMSKSWNSLGGAIKGAAVDSAAVVSQELIKPLLARLSPVTDKIGSMMSGIGSKVIAGLSPITGAFKSVAGGIGGIFSRIGSTISTTLGPITSRVSAILSPVAGKIKAVFGGIGSAISSNLSPALDAISEKISGKVGGALKSLGGAAATLGKSFLVGAGVAGVAIGGLATQAVKGYAEYEQLAGGVETLFKNSSEAVFKYSENAYKTAGLSANQYMETVTSFSASLLQGLKGDTAAAAKYADMAVTDMSDNANKMGTDMARIQDAYQGFAKDNFTMLDNLKLGYGGTAGEMARLINDSGVMGKSFKATAENVKDIPFDKLIQGIHVVQERMGITGTTAKEASETISGSFNSMKASWSDLVAGFSNEDLDLEKLIGNFTSSAETFLKNLSPVLAKAIGGIAQALPEIINQLLPLIPPILGKLLPAVISGIIQLLNAVAQTAPQWIGEILKMLPALIQGFLQLFMAVLTALPQIINIIVPMIPQIVDSLVSALTDPAMLEMMIMAAITLLIAMIEALPTIVNALIGAIPRIVDAIVNTVTRPEFIVKMGEAAVRLMFGIVRGVGSMLGTIGDAAWKVINKIGEVLSPSSLFNIGVNFLKGLWNGISNVTGWITDKIKGFTDGVIKSIKGFFGIHSPSRVMAEIGGFLGEGMAIGISDSIGGVLNAVDDMNGAIYDQVANKITPELALAGTGSFAVSAEDIWPSRDAATSQGNLPQINQTVQLTNGIEVDEYNASLVRQMRRA